MAAEIDVTAFNAFDMVSIEMVLVTSPSVAEVTDPAVVVASLALPSSPVLLAVLLTLTRKLSPLLRKLIFSAPETVSFTATMPCRAAMFGCCSCLLIEATASSIEREDRAVASFRRDTTCGWIFPSPSVTETVSLVVAGVVGRRERHRRTLLRSIGVNRSPLGCGHRQVRSGGGIEG